ncbi:MAG: alpha/beta hydrolase [Planctomycetaceae bacterium]|jgi:esterase/lipase superfamily enzyme|nr:alpha/beta hydrolase [Planctomycetaceae bacterium]
MRVLIFFLTTFFCLAGSSVFADDAWFVDTRRGVEVARLDDNCKWRTSSIDDLLKSHNPEKPLVIVAHGYKMTYPEAKQFGIDFSRLTRRFGEHRFLFWSWDSAKESCGIKTDTLRAGQKADASAIHLTGFLKQLKPKSKVALIGFSYGTRLICTSLQQLATESLQLTSEPNNFNGSDNVSSLRIRLVLLAAAIDQDQFQNGKKFSNVLSITDKVLVNINSADPALLLYPLLKNIKSPRAVGRSGIDTLNMPKDIKSKINSVNVRPEIGIDHTFNSSFHALIERQGEFKKYALFADEQ